MFGIKKWTDSDIVEAVKKGNENALLQLYKQNFASVKKLVISNSGSIEEAEDVMQESVIAAWQNIGKPDFLLNVKLNTYVFSIAKNQWYKQLKRKSRFTLVDEGFNENLKEAEKPLVYDTKIVSEFVKNMDESCRKMLYHFYFDGLDMTTIAEVMGFANADTAKSKKYQCLKKLEAKVKSQYQKEDFL